MVQLFKVASRRYVALCFVFILLGLFPTAWAELMLTQAGITGTSQVVVSKADGAAVRGTVSQVTPDLLYVLPSPRPTLNGRTDPTPATQPVALPWKQIRHVSDGLTPRIALDIWMAQHASELCPTCHGERTVWCPVCKGTRHDPSFATTCPTCKGELLVDCKSIGEKNGQIPCPNSCLKLTVGAWAKQPDGLMWRTWHFAHITQTFSQRHLGDVMFLDPKAIPPISDEGKCPICGGTTWVNDPLCFGTGSRPCPLCLARSWAPPCPNHCDNGRVICPTCGGTGLKKS